MTTDTNKPATAAGPASTWRSPDRTGMRYPEQSDISGGATDCAPAPAVDERTAEDGHLAAAPEQRGELPEPVAKIHSDGYWTVGKSFKEPLNFASMELYTADQLRTAIAAERERNTAAHLACGHPAELMLRSAETGAPLYCELCDDKAGRRDAEKRESELQAELSTLRQQLAEAVRDAKRYRWLRRIDSFAEWNRVGHYAADALDAAIDAAIAAQGEAKPPSVERELFEGE